MGNRVEDLEKEVAVLEAAVDGLTEELVETKERLRQLESDAETELAPSEEGPDSHAEFVPNTDQSEPDDDIASDSDATAEAAGDEADEANREDHDTPDEPVSDDGDDIIVA